MVAEEYDVAVIGAGIVGASTALHLLMKGKKVLLLDPRGAGAGTSYGNAGIIGNIYVLPFGFPAWKDVLRILRDHAIEARIHYSSIPRHLPWLFELYMNSRPKARAQIGDLMWPLEANSTDEHRNLMKGTNAQRHLRTTGRVAVYRSEASFEAGESFRVAAAARGVPFEVMDRAAFQEIEPHLKPVYRKAVRWPSGLRFDNPGAVVKAYAERFTREGGRFVQAAARALQRAPENKWRIEIENGAFKASNVVICAGPWTNEVLEPLGYRFPMALKRGYHKHFRLQGAASIAHAIFDEGYLLAPMEQGYRLATGVEFANPGSPPTPVQIDRALVRARELFPLGDSIEADAWMGNRPCFADSLPVIGPAPRHKGLWLNFGHGHCGMIMGPASGRLLAEMMTNQPAFCDTAPYRADRFHS